MKKTLSTAIAAFNKKNYLEAESLFKECGKLYGDTLFNANLKLIKSRIFYNLNQSNSSEGSPRIAYCIPIMDRLDDIKLTLRKNLSIICQSIKTRIIINIFDQTNESFEWINDNFTEELSNGTLQINRLKPLPFWHFSWAKNSFKKFLDDDEIYSSLDGDNYLTIEEVARTKQVFIEYGPTVIHHFSGSWGDGSSGRVSVYAQHYKKHGYSEDIFPRQFDDISLILNILINETGVKFVCRKEADIFQKSWFLSRFQEKNKWQPPIKKLELGENKSPENPRGVEYVLTDNVIKSFNNINALYCLLKQSGEIDSIKFFEKELMVAKQQAIKCESFDQIAKKALLSYGNNPEPKINKLPTLYSVVKNDGVFIESWIKHYRDLGVKRFIIVDDNSDLPINDLSLGSDVYVFKPVVGNFKYFKTFWLQCLLRRFQEPGSICLCADADEFIDIPIPNSAKENGIKQTQIEYLQENNQSIKKYDRILGLLVDLMPRDESIKIDKSNFLETMDHHCYVEFGAKSMGVYSSHTSVQWAFKDNWQTPYRYDLRFHLFGTFDCLRKVPIFIYNQNMELNQGFHDIKFDGLALTVNKGEFLLPIRHYKMLKVFAPSSGFKKEDLAQYCDRSADNQSKIYSSNLLNLLESWKRLKKKSYVNAIIELA